MLPVGLKERYYADGFLSGYKIAKGYEKGFLTLKPTGVKRRILLPAWQRCSCVRTCTVGNLPGGLLFCFAVPFIPLIFPFFVPTNSEQQSVKIICPFIAVFCKNQALFVYIMSF